jgi:hypothetical protein
MADLPGSDEVEELVQARDPSIRFVGEKIVPVDEHRGQSGVFGATVILKRRVTDMHRFGR